MKNAYLYAIFSLNLVVPENFISGNFCVFGIVINTAVDHPCILFSKIYNRKRKYYNILSIYYGIILLAVSLDLMNSRIIDHSKLH